MQYQFIEEKYFLFLKNIQEYFQSVSGSIHKARNELKIIPFEDEELVVKKFQTPKGIKKIIYTFFSPSKAKKSYEYALKIKKFTPEPIGYIEFSNGVFLGESFFVAKRFAYDFTIREVLLDAAFNDRVAIFEAFAEFTYDLHEAGIFHKDYSPGNILIKKENDKYLFKIVDINRMEFGTLSQQKRLENFNKLWAKDEDLEIILKHYADKAGYEQAQAVQKGIEYSHKLKRFKNFKKRLKGKSVND